MAHPIHLPIHLIERSDTHLKLSESLWQTHEPPQRFFVQGKPESLQLLERLPSRGLAVVGTREPQPRSLREVRRIILDLQGSDLVIVSGFARGIDRMAHETAIEAGLPTIAVLGCGLNIRYPVEHQKLRSTLLDSGGLLISEFSNSEPAKAWNFIRRNRLIAAWSEATWVVEAGERSGALNTASWARGSDRTTYATPSFPGDPALAGNQNLLDQYEALPLWGAPSLGFTWIELSSAGRRRTDAPVEQPDLTPSGLLVAQVERATQQWGSASAEGLLDWALGENWTQSQFFQAFREASIRGLIVDTNGLLTKRQNLGASKQKKSDIK